MVYITAWYIFIVISYIIRVDMAIQVGGAENLTNEIWKIVKKTINSLHSFMLFQKVCA